MPCLRPCSFYKCMTVMNCTTKQSQKRGMVSVSRCPIISFSRAVYSGPVGEKDRYLGGSEDLKGVFQEGRDSVAPERVPETVERSLEPVGWAYAPAGRALESAGRASEPAGRASEPAGRPSRRNGRKQGSHPTPLTTTTTTNIATNNTTLPLHLHHCCYPLLLPQPPQSVVPLPPP